MSVDIFREVARDLFGLVEVPKTIPLKVLGLEADTVPQRAAVVSAFRRRVMEVHPDLQLAYDHPALQQGADDALGTHPEICELVWARDLLLEMAPSDVTGVTGKQGDIRIPCLPVTKKPRTCAKCQRELGEHECWGVWCGRHRQRYRWCWRCVQADDAALAAERRRRRRANRRCAACATIFTPSRSDGQYCSPRCRQKAYRGRCVTTTRSNTVIPPLNVTLHMNLGEPRKGATASAQTLTAAV